MNIFVGVHTNNDLLGIGVALARLGCLGHPGHGRSSPCSGNGWPSPGRQGGQDCDGALVSGKAPIGTRHAGPATASTTPSRGRQIRPKTPWSVIPRVRPRPGTAPEILTVLPR